MAAGFAREAAPLKIAVLEVVAEGRPLVLLVPTTVDCVKPNEPWHAARFAWHVDRLAPGEVRQLLNESWHDEDSEVGAGRVVTLIG